MRLFHTSDTHLGHQQYSRTDASGLNQREQDHYAAWHAVIDAAVAKRPDLFIHAGDLFDGVRPGNRALAHAMEGFLKLSRAGIPTVVIAGNHEHPKLRETGSPFRLFEHLPNIHVVYKGKRETFAFATPSGEASVHAVPQCSDSGALAAEVAAIPAGVGGHDILVLHGSVPSIPAFHHAEFNELTLDPSWFDSRFSYVALGHYHGRQQVTKNAWYCGAPDRVSMAESGEEKGFLDVRLGAGAAQVTFRPLAGRIYVDLPTLDATGLDAAAVRRAAEAALQRVAPASVCRLRITGVATSLRGSLDVRSIQKAASHALNFELRLEWGDDALDVRGAAELGPLQQEFDAFASHQVVSGFDRARLVALAHQMLEG